MSQNLPAWAVQRVSTALEAERKAGKPSTNPADLARRTGLSKSLARRCMFQVLQQQTRREQLELSG